MGKERDCFYYIIALTYDVGLHSRRHSMEFDADTRPFASFDAPSSDGRGIVTFNFSPRNLIQVTRIKQPKLDLVTVGRDSSFPYGGTHQWLVLRKEARILDTNHSE